MQRDAWILRMAKAEQQLIEVAVSLGMDMNMPGHRDPEVRQLQLIEHVANELEGFESEPQLSDAELKERLVDINGVGDKLAGQILEVLR